MAERKENVQIVESFPLPAFCFRIWQRGAAVLPRGRAQRYGTSTPLNGYPLMTPAEDDGLHKLESWYSKAASMATFNRIGRTW